MLLVHANSHVHRGKIVEWLWAGSEPPREPLREVQKIVSQVRAVLRNTESQPEVLTENGQYRLKIDESVVDYYVFSQLAEQGRIAARKGDRGKAIKVLKQALELWPDEPVLSNVDLPWAHQIDETLVRESFVPACRAYFEARMTEDHHELVLPELRRLMRRFDTNETLAELYLRALMDVDGAASVVDFYRGFAHRLRETFDIEPGPDLSAAYRQLIDRQPPATAYGRPEPPCLLPRDVADFVGRSAILETLDSWLLAPGSSAVVALHGVGGVGKTAIVRRWANTRIHGFPDGQLYFDLDGYGRGGTVKPASVLAAFLAALGIEEPPPDEAARVSLLRHRLQGRRVLVVLDNVRDGEDIRPLLDATASCPVLLTSRRRPGLTDCRQLAVPAFERAESVELLRRRIYDRRPQEEPDAVGDLAAFCAGLPLGLSIAAEYVVNRTELTIRQLSDQLSEDSGRRLLDAGGDGAEQTLRTVFASSCGALEPSAGRLLTLLGLHPSATVTVPAAAAVAGLNSTETERIFETLLSANLLEQKTGTRYQLHDLVHNYLADEARRRTSADDRSAAARRMTDFYLGTVVNAVRWIAPQLTEVPPTSSPSTAVPLAFHDHDDAMNWCVEQRSQVLAVSRSAAEHRLHEQVWRTIGLFGELLRRHGDPAGVIEIHQLAVRSAIACGEREGEAMLLNNLGLIHQNLRHYRQAESCFRRALEISRELDAVVGEASCLHNLGATWFERERADLAAEPVSQGLALFTEAGYEEGRGRAHLLLGDVRRALGDRDAAQGHYEAALKIRERNGNADGRGEALVRLAALQLDRGGTAAEAVRRCEETLVIHGRSRDERKTTAALHVLAQARMKLGEYEEAAAAAGQAVLIAESRGDLRAKALALDLAAQSELRLDDPAAARAKWSQALVLLEEIGDSRAGGIRERLDGLGAARSVPGQRLVSGSEDAPAAWAEQCDDRERSQ